MSMSIFDKPFQSEPYMFAGKENTIREAFQIWQVQGLGSGSGTVITNSQLIALLDQRYDVSTKNSKGNIINSLTN